MMKNSELDYKGILSSAVRVQLTDLLRAIAIANLGKRKDLRKLCSIAIELLDNAQRHCHTNNVTFNWYIEDEYLIIRVENDATEENALRLREQAAAVGIMTATEITEEFKRQMMNPAFNARGGAGLGILHIAKKNGGKFDVAVHKSETGDGYICTSIVQTSLLTPVA